MYTLILDDAAPPRSEARERLDVALQRPLDPEQAAEYERQVAQERWEQQYLRETRSPEAMAQDAALASVTYGED